jgi:obg-like ATPase 1
MAVPAKKAGKEPEPEREVLGKVGAHLKMGVVGLPNVGKSSLFNLMTKLSVPAENYPFCTIDPNKARVTVPDERWFWLADHLYKPKSRVQNYLEVVDIAGLVKGASAGQGLGNNFLSHINAVDGIFHVTRIFESEEITHVEGEIDPVRDLQIIHEELLLKDIEMVTKKVEPLSRLARADKTKRAELEVLQKVLVVLEKDRKDVRLAEWNGKEIEVINTLGLLTAKPCAYLINMSEEDYLKQKSKWLPKIKAWVESRNKDPIIPLSVAFEQKLFNMDPKEAEEYCKANNTRSMLPRIAKTGFSILQLITFFTCGEDEVRAWTTHRSATAPQAAGVIHTDFEKYFIMAEVMKYADLKELGTEAALKAAGKYRQQGKLYQVEDGDIMYFKHNAGGASKK